MWGLDHRYRSLAQKPKNIGNLTETSIMMNFIYVIALNVLIIFYFRKFGYWPPLPEPGPKTEKNRKAYGGFDYYEFYICCSLECADPFFIFGNVGTGHRYRSPTAKPKKIENL